MSRNFERTKGRDAVNLGCMGTDELAELRAEVAELRRLVKSVLPKTSPRIPEHARVGERMRIDPTVQLLCNAANPISIGDGTAIYRGTEITGPVVIGEGCFINRDGYIRPGVTLGNWVFLGPFVRLITDGHEIGAPGKRAGKNTSLPITVGDGAWIGAGSTVIGGVTIGAGAVVAAGSLVNKDVPANTIVGGVPARVIRELNDETAPTLPREDEGGPAFGVRGQATWRQIAPSQVITID